MNNNSLSKMMKLMSEPIPGAWDFSDEKSQPAFATSNNIRLRPITSSDVDIYIDIRMQYSMMVRAAIGTETHTKEGITQLRGCRYGDIGAKKHTANCRWLISGSFACCSDYLFL